MARGVGARYGPHMATERTQTPQLRQPTELIDMWFDLCEQLLTVQRQGMRAVVGMFAPLIHAAQEAEAPTSSATLQTAAARQQESREARQDDRQPART